VPAKPALILILPTGRADQREGSSWRFGCGKQAKVGALFPLVGVEQREFLNIAGNFKKMAGHFLKSNGYAPEQRDEKTDYTHIDDNA